MNVAKRIAFLSPASYQLIHVLDRDISALSGGELQRFAITMVVIQAADVYVFDEPTSYLDIRQRLKASQMIRSLIFKPHDSATTADIVLDSERPSTRDDKCVFTCLLQK